MAAEWLDSKALKALNGDEDAPEEIPSREKREPRAAVYDPSKLIVPLPMSDEVEKIRYIPPVIQKCNEISSSVSSNPNLVMPDPHFDIFEHFKVNWIPAPEFETH